MIRAISLVVGLALCSAGCASLEQRTARFSHLSCAQLATALEYEKRGERTARRTGVITGIASILETGDDDDLLSIDSDMNFLDADDRRLSVKAIEAEQQRRCAAPVNSIGG